MNKAAAVLSVFLFPCFSFAGDFEEGLSSARKAELTVPAPTFEVESSGAEMDSFLSILTPLSKFRNFQEKGQL
ncbi:MAG: hypothetical protein Fur0012_11270 [Elusimicrobiota bacterium]